MPPAFTVRLWGVRGSVPAPGAATRRHGGNTSCVSVRTRGGRCLVLDAGTGLRALGDDLLRGAAPNESALDVALFLTHAHWDHVQGLPFFAPLYAPQARVVVHTPAALDGAVESAVRAQMRPPSFPVRFDALSSAVTFRGVGGAGVQVGDALVRPIPAHHTGGAVGWRVDDAAGAPAVAYLPDNEIAESRDGHDLRGAWLVALRGCRLLLHDATYTPTELPAHRGWGHSSWDEAVRLAVEAGVERLVLFHHHPDRSDEAVDRLVADARALARSLGSPLRVLAAAEGLVLHV